MTIKHVAMATLITAALSTSALALSLTLVSSGHADDTPTPTVQAYTAPDVPMPTTSRDTATVAPAPTPVATPDPMVGSDTAPVIPPAPGSAASIVVPPTVGTVEHAPEDRVVPPCQSEDSTNCYWDAATMGNGIGDSFVNWNGVYYYAR